MSEEPAQPLASTTEPNAGTPAVPSSINMPDHWIRQTATYQAYVRLARPTLDWVTVAWLWWCGMGQPWFQNKFDITATGMAIAWAGVVYGFKFTEKIKGVA